MQWTLVLLSVIGLTAMSPLDTKSIKELFICSDVTYKSGKIEKKLRSLLEELRHTMLTGNGTMPVLDPWKVPSITTNGEIVPGLSLLLNDVKVSKLSTFSVEMLKVQRAKLSFKHRVTFDFQVLQLEMEAAHYNMRLSTDTISLSGNGDATINVIKPRISGYVVVKPIFGIGSIRLRIQEAKIHFRLEEFHSHINGMMNGNKEVSDAINIYLKHFVPEAVKFYEEQITKALSHKVLLLGNKILANLNVMDLLG